jgi:hypothetical protein
MKKSIKDVSQYQVPFTWGTELHSKELAIMFNKQREVIELFSSIERLPALPLDIGKADSMSFLRDLLFRANIELSEAYTEYLKLLTMLSSNVDREDMIPTLYAFNEELADIAHFLIEAMIYSNIEVDDLENYLDIYLERNEFKGMSSKGNPLATSLRVAQYLNNTIGYPQILKLPAFNILAGYEEESICLKGGSRITPDRLFIFQDSAWRITHELMSCANHLRSSNWSLSGTQTDFALYHEKLLSVWIEFCRLLVALDIDVVNIYSLYYRKNIINQERAKSLILKTTHGKKS